MCGTGCWAGGQLNVQFAAVVRSVGEVIADVVCRVGDPHGDVVIGREARGGDDVAGDGDGRRGRSGGSSCAWVVGRGISHQLLRSPHGGASHLLPPPIPQIGWFNRTPSTQAKTSGRSRGGPVPGPLAAGPADKGTFCGLAPNGRTSADVRWERQKHGGPASSSRQSVDRITPPTRARVLDADGRLSQARVDAARGERH